MAWYSALDERINHSTAAESAKYEVANIGQHGDQTESELRERYASWRRDHAKLQAIQAAAREIDAQIDAAVVADENATRALRAELEDPATPAERMIQVRQALNQAAVELEQTIKRLQAEKDAAGQELRLFAVKSTAGPIIENAWCKLGAAGERLKVLERTANALAPLLHSINKRADDAALHAQHERERQQRRSEGFRLGGVYELSELEAAEKLHGAVADEFNAIERRLFDEATALREKRLSELRAN